MKNALAAALLAACSLAAAAQDAPDDSLYQAFGGTAGFTKLGDDLVTRIMADTRLQPFFSETNPKHLRKQLADQLCQVAGGPCKYDGPSMKDAHADFEIRKGDFNALVEVLQDAMDAQGVPFGAQNRLLARLAPMHRDIVTKP